MKAPPAPPKDPLALGLGSLGAGVAFGGACLTAAQIVASILRGELERSGYRETAADPLLAGLIAAGGGGGVWGWDCSFEPDNIWERGVIAVVAAVGAILVGFPAGPVHPVLGGLGGVVLLFFTISPRVL